VQIPSSILNSLKGYLARPSWAIKANGHSEEPPG